MNSGAYATKGTNYVKFTNGLIIQWGRTTTSYINFPIPFTNNSYGIAGTCNFNTATEKAHGFFNTPTTTNIQIGGMTSDIYPFYWVAVGY